jgi:hypothetical protein
MSDQQHDHEADEEERRRHRRRENDSDSNITVSDFRLSIKEVIFLVGILVSVATTLFKFNNTLELAQSEHKLTYELMAAKVTQSQENITRLEKNQDSLKEQLSDIERLTSQLYLKSKGKD